MSTTAKVIAAKGRVVPREENSRRYISDSAEEEVELTTYYRRRLMDGDLIEILPELPRSAKKADETVAALRNDHPWIPAAEKED
jgi:hypothetical protein